MKITKVIRESFAPKHKKVPDDKAGDKKAESVNTKKTYTFKFYMLILSGAVAIIGVCLFVLYFISLNMALGAPGIIMTGAGVLAFRYYWNKEESIAIEHIGEGKVGNNANCLNIHPNIIQFATMLKPQGFPMECENLKKKYFVNIWDGKVYVPFILPDQQYMDPDTYAMRVIDLPAHRRIFARKPKLLQRLKTALLVIAIGIIWLLILTTTGG